MGKSFGIKMNTNTEDGGIETSLDMDWVASLKKKVSDTNYKDRNREPKLFRVPTILKSVDPQVYEPLLVSLGPYHHDKPDLQAMNQLKWKCLKFVLRKNPSVTLDHYLDLIKGLETQARGAYSEKVEMSSNNFVEMMLLDGCFLMLTIMRRNFVVEIWTQNLVVRDIFKLENQLPFILLEKLCATAFPYWQPLHFRLCTVEFIGSHFSINSNNIEPPSDNETFRHIIHLCLSCIDPTTNHGNQSSNTFGFLCQSKLVKTVFVSWPSKLRSFLLSQGNKIRTGRDANPKEDLNGNGTGNQSSTLGFLCNSKPVKTVFVSLPSKLCTSLLSLVSKIPTVRDANPEEDLPVPGIPWIPSATVCNEAIGDSTTMLLRNLIAYEQCSMDSKFHVTSYVVLMDSLIDTAADVELLQQNEIIISNLGDSKVIASLFNKLGATVSYDSDDFYLVDVFTAMRKHYDNRYNKLRAWFNRDYFFRRRWAFISLFGALALFVLTTVQTTFTVLSYYLSSK